MAEPPAGSPGASAGAGQGGSGVELRVAGAWSGSVAVPPLESGTVQALRLQLSALSLRPPEALRLICAGRTLKDSPAHEHLPLPASPAASPAAAPATPQAPTPACAGDTPTTPVGASAAAASGSFADPAQGEALHGAEALAEAFRTTTLEAAGVKPGSKILVTVLKAPSGPHAVAPNATSQPATPPAPSFATGRAAGLAAHDGPALGAPSGREKGGEATGAVRQAPAGDSAVEGAPMEVDPDAAHQRLLRIRAAAEALAARTQRESRQRGGRGRRMRENWDVDLELEDQSGTPLVFPSELDRRSLVAGLLLHSKGRAYLRREEYSNALEVLQMAEEAFALCDQSLLQHVDNVGMMLLDMAWCRFMMRDTASLAQARQHLHRARATLEKAHGVDLSRLRRLQGGFQPELAIYLRLHLLEGVVAFHAGEREEASRRFRSARMLLRQLEVSDDAVVALLSMGFELREARRGLRMASGDVDRAAEFALQQRERAVRRREEDRRKEQERRARRKYGTTPSGGVVDTDLLAELSILGMQEKVVAEALRLADNVKEAAVDSLLDPGKLAAIKESLAAKKKGSAPPIDPMALALLLSEGFNQSQVERAVSEAGGDLDKARQILLQNLDASASGAQGSGGSAGPTDGDGTGPSTAAPMETEVGEGGAAGAVHTEGTGDEDVGSEEESEDEGEEQDGARDEEMEAEVAKDVSGDPYEEYDVEVLREAEALAEYEALLAS